MVPEIEGGVDLEIVEKGQGTDNMTGDLPLMKEMGQGQETDGVGHTQMIAEIHAQGSGDMAGTHTRERGGAHGRGLEMTQLTGRDTGHTEGHLHRPLDRKTRSAVPASQQVLTHSRQLT